MQNNKCFELFAEFLRQTNPIITKHIFFFYYYKHLTIFQVKKNLGVGERKS
jgi:hypothetical protein